MGRLLESAKNNVLYCCICVHCNLRQKEGLGIKAFFEEYKLCSCPICGRTMVNMSDFNDAWDLWALERG